MSDWKKLRELARGWQPPAELNHSRPREVRLTRKGRAVIAVAVALLAAAVHSGVALYSSAERDQQRDRQLREAGVVGIAQIVARHRGEGDRGQASVTYRFIAGDKVYERRTRVARPAWNRLSVGSKVLVRYVPSNPQWSSLPGLQQTRQTPFVFAPIVFGILAAAAGVVFLVIRRERRLLAKGRPTLGIVTRVSNHQLVHGGHVHHVYVEFLVLSGAKASAHFQTSKKNVPPGTTLCLLYDPDNPQRITPYPMSLVCPAP